MQAEMIVEAVFRGLKLKFVPEYRFHETRKWRIDYFLPELKTGIEIEGGIWTGGRHTRGGGFSRDCEKYNQATVSGLKILRYPAHEIVKTNGLRVYADIQELKKKMEEK